MDDTNLDEIMEGDIKNFSDNISEKITNFKDEVSDEIISEFNKLPQLNVESNVVQKKKEFVFRDISWKTYRAASIGIIFISMFMANYIKIVAESKFDDPYLKMILNIILLFFIINLGIFLFYKTYFCIKCGTYVYADYDSAVGRLTVRTKTLDNSEKFPPQVHIFTKDKDPRSKSTL